jgi:hypothetical protein
MYGIPRMDTQGRQEPQRRAERQGPSLCEERRAQLETTSTRGRLKARLFLRKDEWNEKEVNILRNSERPEL